MFIDIVLHPNGPDTTFVEIEDQDKRSINIGELVTVEDGYMRIRIYPEDIVAYYKTQSSK